MLPSGHQNEGGWGITATVAAALARAGWDAALNIVNQARSLVLGSPSTPQPAAAIIPQPGIISINTEEDAEAVPAGDDLNPLPVQSPLEEARVAAQVKLEEELEAEARLKAEQAEAKKQRQLEAKAKKQALAAKKAEAARQKALAAQKIKEEAQEREKQRLNRLFAIFMGTQPVGTPRQVGLDAGADFFGMTFDEFIEAYADFLEEALLKFIAVGENLDQEAARNARREAAGIIRNALKDKFETRKAEAAEALAEEEARRQTQIQIQRRETEAAQRQVQLQRLLLPEGVNVDQPGINRTDFERIEGHLFLEREDGSPERVPNVLAPRLLMNRTLIVRFYAEAEAIASQLPSNYNATTFLANIRDFIRALAVNLNKNRNKFSLFNDNWLSDRQRIAYLAALGLRKASSLQSFGEHFANTLWTFKSLEDYLKPYFNPVAFEQLKQIISNAIAALNQSKATPNAEFKLESEEVFSPQSAASINPFPFAVSALQGIYQYLSTNDQRALLKWVKVRGNGTYSHLKSLKEAVPLQQQFFENPYLFPFYLTQEGNLNSDHFWNLLQAFNPRTREACLCPIYSWEAYANNNKACLCAEDHPQLCLQADRFALAMMVAGIALEANTACNQFTAEEWAQALASAQTGEPILNDDGEWKNDDGEWNAHLKNLESPRAMHALAAAAAAFLNHFPNEWLTYGNLKIVRNYSNNHRPVIQILNQEGTIYNSLEDRLAHRVEVDPKFGKALDEIKTRFGKRPAQSFSQSNSYASSSSSCSSSSSSSSSYDYE